MQLPDGERAEIDLAKLTEYLLNPDHPDVSGKANFFERLGYRRTDPWMLAHGLLRVAQTGTVAETVATSYGTKYVVDGEIFAPLGRSYALRTVWMRQSQNVAPRFVTAYPSAP